MFCTSGYATLISGVGISPLPASFFPLHPVITKGKMRKIYISFFIMIGLYS